MCTNVKHLVGRVANTTISSMLLVLLHSAIDCCISNVKVKGASSEAFFI